MATQTRRVRQGARSGERRRGGKRQHVSLPVQFAFVAARTHTTLAEGTGIIEDISRGGCRLVIGDIDREGIPVRDALIVIHFLPESGWGDGVIGEMRHLQPAPTALATIGIAWRASVNKGAAVVRQLLDAASTATLHQRCRERLQLLLASVRDVTADECVFLDELRASGVSYRKDEEGLLVAYLRRFIERERKKQCRVGVEKLRRQFAARVRQYLRAIRCMRRAIAS